MDKVDRFGELIGRALRDEAAACHLPPDFAERFRRCGFAAGLLSKGALPRWMKVAASLAVLASFAAAAAVVGQALVGTQGAGKSSGVLVDPETEMISQQGGNTMMARKMATLVGAAMVSVAVPAQELTSEPTFVFLRPETSSFWHTATNNVMTVPVDYPSGATAATLYVSGVKYNRTYADLTQGSFTFDLPPAESKETENVYDLALVFNDPSETVRTAKLGLIQGLTPDAEGITRCLAPANGRLWEKARTCAVVPIPYGTTSFKVNGVETDTGLNGAQGWYALPIRGGARMSLSLIANEVNYAASILGGGAGLLVIFK